MATIGDQLLQPEAGWQRYDDRNDCISYIGLWEDGTSSDIRYCYNATLKQTNDVDAVARFEFKGTKIRLIDRTSPSWRATMQYINIDGVEYEFSPSLKDGYQIIAFEKLDLDDKIHTVEIGNKSKDSWISFDALDIDDTGHLILKIGNKLPEPENNWNRFDDLDALVLYEGISWTDEVSNTSYDKTIKVSTAQNEYYQFDYIGKGFRLINRLDNTYPIDKSISIFIDDIEVDKISQYDKTTKEQILIYENISDIDQKHTIKVVNNGNKMSIDCIDIKEGVLLPTLSRDYEFPVAIIEASELNAYCASLINKEEQLLVTPKGSMYLTNGEGGYVTIIEKGESSVLSSDVKYQHHSESKINNVSDALDFILTDMNSNRQIMIELLNKMLEV